MIMRSMNIAPKDKAKKASYKRRSLALDQRDQTVAKINRTEEIFCSTKPRTNSLLTLHILPHTGAEEQEPRGFDSTPKDPDGPARIGAGIVQRI